MQPVQFAPQFILGRPSEMRPLILGFIRPQQSLCELLSGFLSRGVLLGISVFSELLLVRSSNPYSTPLLLKPQTKLEMNMYMCPA